MPGSGFSPPRSFPERFEQQVREVKHRSAAEIFEAITADLLVFSEPSDDINIVVIMRM